MAVSVLFSAMAILLLLDTAELAVLPCSRDLARIEKGRKCRKPCETDQDCNVKRNRRCLCDDWCGRSCYNPEEECKLPEKPEHGTIIRGESLAHGRVIKYECDPSMTLSGDRVRKCRSDRQWSGKKPRCVPFESCGQAGDTEGVVTVGKVVGGKAAVEGAWPWQALLLRNYRYIAEQLHDPERGFAGGSVINKKWILTAGHIFDATSIFPRGMRTLRWKDTFLVILGMTEFPKVGESLPEHVKIFEPLEVIRHEKYDKRLMDYDVALIRVGKVYKVKGKKIAVDDKTTHGEITYSRFIRPVCLHCLNGCDGMSYSNVSHGSYCSVRGKSKTKHLDSLDADVMVTGFGSNVSRSPWSFDFQFPGALQQVRMNIQEDKSCNSALRYINSMLALSNMPAMKYTKRMFCARSSERFGGDTCQGDSGGAVVKQVTNAIGDTCWVQLGIVSWGAGCGQLDDNGNAVPAYYANTRSFTEWIVHKMQKAISCNPPEHPTNGRAIAVARSIGSVVRYVCDDAHTLFGKGEGKCSEEGTWGPVPVCIDQSQCGRAGDIGDANQVIGIGRVVGGDNAIEGAWPWHALITTYDENVLVALDDLRGGGSLLNTNWVMTVASIFSDYPKHTGGWWKSVIVSLGITHRPQGYNLLSKNVKMFQPSNVHIHPKFESDTFNNDIALIKLGGEFVLSRDGKRLLLPSTSTGNLTITPHIRPICLPCTPNSCTSNVLKKTAVDGGASLDGTEGNEEACNIEYAFLMGKNSIGKVGVVGTGFGHVSPISPNEWGKDLHTSESLQQVTLNIQERSYCNKAVQLLNKDRHQFKAVFTDQMICGVGRNSNGKLVDTCKGDGGAPIVREVYDNSKNESCFVQLGILSWGNGCAQSTYVENEKFIYPAFYTDVKSFLPWISATMRTHE